MRKRGISPLIAGVLLIAFVILLFVVINIWIKRAAIEPAMEKPGEKLPSAIEGLSTDIDIGKSLITGNTISLTLFNAGTTDIIGFLIKVIGKNGADLVRVDLPTNLKPLESITIDVTFDRPKTGDVEDIEIVPILDSGIATSAQTSAGETNIETIEGPFEYWTDLGEIGAGGIDTIRYLGNGIVITGDGEAHVYRSTDYGLSWTDLGVIASGVIRGSAYLGDGIAILGDSMGHVHRSTDYGLSWTDLGSISSGIDFGMEYLGNGIVIFGTEGSPEGGGHVFRSTDYGLSWTDLGSIASSGGPFNSVIKRMVYLEEGIVIFGDDDSFGSGHVFRSTDYGLSWTDLGAISSGIWSMTYLGSGIALLGDDTGHVFRSTDYGLSWTDLEDITGGSIAGAMEYIENGIVLLGSNNEHIYRSTDYGLNWVDLGKIASNNIYAMEYLGGGIVITANADNPQHIYRSTSDLS